MMGPAKDALFVTGHPIYRNKNKSLRGKSKSIGRV
jgi:hypothetical protein